MLVAPGVVRYAVVPASEAKLGGDAVQGLTTALRGPSSPVTVSQPVLLAVNIVNNSPAVQFLWAPNAPCAYVFSITNLSTNKMADVRPPQCFENLYSPPIERLSPGTATLLEFELESQELSGAPGRYEVRVRSIASYTGEEMTSMEDLKIASNPVSIVVVR